MQSIVSYLSRQLRIQNLTVSLEDRQNDKQSGRISSETDLQDDGQEPADCGDPSRLVAEKSEHCEREVHQ